jgi:hypothetical protein
MRKKGNATLPLFPPLRRVASSEKASSVFPGISTDSLKGYYLERQNPGQNSISNNIKQLFRNIGFGSSSEATFL